MYMIVWGLTVYCIYYLTMKEENPAVSSNIALLAKKIVGDTVATYPHDACIDVCTDNRKNFDSDQISDLPPKH